MLSLLLTVFLIQTFIHVIKSLGSATINELLWLLCSKLPTRTSKAIDQHIRLKRAVLHLKREMTGVSAQDDFAKWAKLRRQHDKTVAEYDKCAASLQLSRIKFDTAVKFVQFVSTNGLRLFLQFWYAREAMFWIPEGWVPGYVEWILSFPKAPLGSVSIQIWLVACASIISLLGEAITAVYMLGTKRAIDQQEAQAAHTTGGPEKKAL